MNKHEGMPDPEKIKEILDVVSEKIPGLLKELSGLLYSPESAKQYAEAAATFYKELIKAGMTPEQISDIVMGTIAAALDTGDLVSGNLERQSIQLESQNGSEYSPENI